ncbi:MAG: hypothetical protein K2J86_02915 [Prevotella sp.]|nr:hypothetical protein [Prevotella sp.]MDE6807844.1 hypothetical protein [Prevotella sp.]
MKQYFFLEKCFLYLCTRSRITTKHVKNCNPVSTNGGQPVIDAFYRIYGIDIKKAGCLNNVDLQVQRYEKYLIYVRKMDIILFGFQNFIMVVF